MQYHQLITAITKAGYQQFAWLRTVKVVAGQMDINEDDMCWEWLEAYINFVLPAGEYEITEDGKHLVPLAETYYHYLVACAGKADKEK